MASKWDDFFPVVIFFYKSFWKQKMTLTFESPLFQTLNDYYRIFKYYKKTKGRREVKRKLEKDKYQTKCKN